MKRKLTFIILTYNEAHNLAASIESAATLGDVLVIDSGSIDGTVEVAQSYSVRVVHHSWAGFSGQRNFAMQLVPAGEWVFFLDADERIDVEMHNFLLNFEPQVEAYYVRRINFFMGQRLLRAGRYPDRQLRLILNGAARFEDREVHERVLFTGQARELPGHLLHQSAYSMERLLTKHLEYARLEAQALTRSPVTKKWLFSTDPQRRRRWLKEKIWVNLPARGAIRVFWLLFVKRGILDGQRGIAYSRMLAAYECQVDCFLAAAKYHSS